MNKLRPHHLLCTQGYSGKGYSEDFVENMDIVVEDINKENAKIQLVFSADNICSKCPNLLESNKCACTKVNVLDEKVVKYFNLEEKEYVYSEVVNYIKENITEEIMDDICGSCEWYSISHCKKRMGC